MSTSLLVSASLLAAASLSGCGADAGGGDVTRALTALDVAQPDGWDREIALPEARDLNPAPDVVEIELEAKVTELEILPGKKTAAWTYNGGLPGPLIRARVGDRVIVHFKNLLPEATTIHWHGIRVPNDMDGAPGATQPPIESGGEFRYEFTVKDAGTYWYHPHIDSAAQVGRGLYGPFIVEDPSDPRVFGDELVLVLSDMSLDEEGVIAPADSGGKFGDLFGREGAVVLVNGKIRPRLQARAGKQQRWRVVNAARARYFSLGIRDHRFIRLGGDNGLAARTEDVYNVLVTPGERTDVVFTPSDAPGASRVISWLPPNRGYGSQFARERRDLMLIETVDLPPVTPAPIPHQLRTIEPIDVTGASERTVELTIKLGNNDVVMGINGVHHHHAKPIEAVIGETQIWRVVNDTDFAHPFHLHGYFFQVLDDTRVPEWKDTVNVPTKSELRIAVRFDDRPGMWMYHCHILDHAEAGMMGHLRVLPPHVPAENGVTY